MESERTYEITVNENQLKAMRNALEEYFRLRLGQAYELIEDWAFGELDWNAPKSEERDRAMDRAFLRRDDAAEVFRTAYRIARGNTYRNCSTETSRICEDIWQVVRHQIWLDEDGPEKMPWSVDSRELFPVSSEPPVVIKSVSTCKLDKKRRKTE
jgi:hypothetical protein